MDETIVFSIGEYGLLDLFPWPMLAIFGVIAVALYIPRIRTIWPISTFFFLRSRPRTNAIGFSIFVGLIFIPHLLIALVSLQSDKAALRNSDYKTVEICGQVETSNDDGYVESQFAAMSIVLDGVEYDPPGGIHGLWIVADIKSVLREPVPYTLFVNGNTLLQVSKQNSSVARACQ